MDQKRIQQIVQILQIEDNAGKSYAYTRQLLLSKGFNEQEIIQGGYQFPYDGKPNQPAAQNPVEQFYKQHPDLADKAAQTLLNDIAAEQREKLLANTAASQFGDIQTSSYYEVQAADQIGFPIYRIFFITLIIGVLAIKYHWLNQVVSIISFTASAYFGYLWWRQWRASHRRR